MPSADDRQVPDGLHELGALGSTDPVEVHHAHAAVQAALFGRSVNPIAVGRYVLMRPLGSGGGGTVYRSYDTELHREVAIKVLPAVSGSADERDALLDEARLVAALSHPNVVAVHDVGAIPTSAEQDLGTAGVYVVMELVEGVDLATWCRSEPRGWGESLPILLAAARGVMAAHEAGIVHRDLKPHNVRIGDDGRVRVLDFGLAAALSDSTELQPTAGTPPYMAPEQHDGHTAREASDQFSFCVMAWEVLYGTRPFSGESVAALAAAKRSGPPPLPSADIPPPLGAALSRGLQPSPHDRFESMHALLEAMDQPRRTHATRRAMVAVAVLAAGLVVATAGRDDDRVCADISERARESRGPEIRTRVQRSVLAVNAPYRDDAWSAIEDAFDTWSQRWQAEYASACEADVRPEVLAARTLCLSHQPDAVRRTSLLLEEADDTIVQHASALADGLPEPSDCLEPNAASLDVPLALSVADPARRSSLIALQAEIQRAKLLHRAGKLKRATRLAESLEARALAEDDLHTRAEALLLMCRTGGLDGTPATREELCYRALDAAETSGSARLPIVALIRLAETVGQPDERERAEALFHAASARLMAAPQEIRTPSMMSWYLGARGRFEASRGDREAGLDLLRRSAELLESTGASDRAQLLPTVLAMASVSSELGRMHDAERHFQRARRIASKAHGEQHPRTGLVENNYGNFLHAAGRDEEAATVLLRALAIKTGAFGEGAPALATTHLVLARVFHALGRHAEALHHVDESLALHDHFFPGSGERRALAVAVRADALRGLGRCEEIVPELRALEGNAVASDGRPRFDPSDLSISLGRCLQSLGDDDGAQAAFMRALAIQESYWGGGDRHLVQTLLELGSANDLYRARDIVAATEGDPADATKVAAALAALSRRLDE